MGKFKKGDVVKIKGNLKAGKIYGVCSFVHKMSKYKGKIATVDFCSTMNGICLIDIDNHEWCWSSEMLEKVEDKKHFKSLPRYFTGTVKIENGFITEIVKEKKEILDKVEKEYLSVVIKPFKEKVTCIAIREFSAGKCFLFIDIIGGDGFGLPKFKRGTMYKNMQMNREYTLQELGLD